MEVLDNISKLLGDDLKGTVRPGAKVRIAASSFSIYAFEALRRELENVEALEFIFTTPTFVAQEATDKVARAPREFHIPQAGGERGFHGSEFEIRLKNKLTQRAIARECAEWIRRKTQFRSNRSGAPMQQFACVEATEGATVYMPLHGFTAVDLGYQQGNAVSNFVNKMDEPVATRTFLALFDQIWQDSEKLIDVTDLIRDHIASVYKENSPQRIYFLMLFSIFSEFLQDINEDVLPNERTGYQESAIWQKLYSFQRDAATGIINKLETYNGCILADSVGLGKTFTALAVIKYYELRNRTVLVLCPKKLADNWTTYKGNLKNNPLVRDRFSYDVLCHTDLLRDRGESLGMRLSQVNWSNYDLVVIDESHNFRNDDAFKDRETRYQRLMNRIVRQGVRTKVLMLSATPVNNRFNDLKNQLALAYEGEPENLKSKLSTERNIDLIFRRAQTAFNVWSKLPAEQRTPAAILSSLDFDFFELLDAVTIARSRRHITTFYDTKEIGEFPTRRKPLSFHWRLTSRTDVMGFNQIFLELAALKLGVYMPVSYILPSRVSKYEEIYDTEVSGGGGKLKQRDRELSLRSLMTVNLLKRLESSVAAFRLTLGKLQRFHLSTLARIENFRRTGQGGSFSDPSLAFDDAEPDEDVDFLDPEDGPEAQTPGKIAIELADMDLPSWERDLKADLGRIEGLLEEMEKVSPADDAKLQHLKEHILAKIEAPINPGNRKVLLFSAFADTADYLYQHLAPMLQQRHNLHTARVVGSDRPKSTLGRRMDFQDLLTLFSPISKEKALLLPDEQGEIDLLIATDCISEGQNLQDCDYLINYDNLAMKFRFKVQSYQTEAVKAVVDCFNGQPLQTGLGYRIDPGRVATGQQARLEMDSGFKNSDLLLPAEAVLKNLQAVQVRQNLPVSESLKQTKVSPVNLDVEMETGTGKTYCYIKTIFELNKNYGWCKFIVVVPSIAIREGVAQSLADTAEHFLEGYGKRVRSFIYDSKALHNLESFSSDSGINLMIINVQAFNARGKDARRIYEELDDFQSRRPIDVIAANRPILILDEPQKMEGARTVESMKEFNPLFILRYSATHKQEHNKVYRLDALDAFNQKLVKKIGVRGISVKGQAGASAYLYLQSIEVSVDKPPQARVEMEIRQENGIARKLRMLAKGDNLRAKSGELDQYQGYVVADMNANDGTLSFTNGVTLTVGDACGDVTDAVLRGLQIRESIQAHFEKEQQLFAKGIKVLTLFFIDEVAKYRQYEGSQEKPGEYAAIFEDEYKAHLNEVLTLEPSEYNHYLKRIEPGRTHEGYFSIDKRSKRLVDPDVGARSAERTSDDVDAYDLILRRKAQLLSFEEPVRFIFAHSALREGWDNPNVFVIGMLKKADPENVTSRRQEVGRGLRLCVNQRGDRMDDPATVHELNVLTVVAAEGYKEFVAGLQREIAEAISARPRRADLGYFTGKVPQTDAGDVQVTPAMAKAITRYLIKNDYTDNDDKITTGYHDAKSAGTIAPLPPELAAYSVQILKLIDSVFTDSQIPLPEDDRRTKRNNLNPNFQKGAFQALWNRIHRKAVYAVRFESGELVAKCITALDSELTVAPLQYVVQRGEQLAATTYEGLQAGEGFRLNETQTASLKSSVQSAVKYDLIGKLAEQTQLTRGTIGRILGGIKPSVFAFYQVNPEDFLRNVARLIDEQKATVVVDHLTYSAVDEAYGVDIFTEEKLPTDSGRAVKTNRHIFDYVFTDSKNEREFVAVLDSGAEVEVYAKLPKAFTIPTPVGGYTPDWAIALKHGAVKHLYFVAETKGSMSSMEFRKIEETKIECARKFFSRITSDQVKYGVVNSYAKLMELVR